MNKKRFVKDYMHSNHATIRPEDTFKEAVRLMIKHKTNGLVVTDEANKVLGILSSWDVISYIVPDYLEEDKHLAALESGDVFAQRIKMLEDKLVSEFMTKQVHVVKETSTLMEAAAILSEFHIRQLPVVTETNTLVGYLNRTDIKLVIGEVLGIKD